MTQRVPLANGKGVVIVDDVDYERVTDHHSWCILLGRHTDYAQARMNRKQVLMHRFILGFGPGDPQVDHINQDGFDNRRSNLRATDQSHNEANSSKRGETPWSPYKGVTWSRNGWAAQITVDYVHYNLGRFADEEAAAHAYNEAAINAWGEYAQLNLTRKSNHVVL